MKKPEQNATFYIDLEIPRKGTDTKATIKLIPFGLNIRSKKNIEFTYSERNGNPKSLYYISKIVSEIKNTKTLKYILSNEFDKVSNYDIKLINKLINDSNYSKSDLVHHLKELKRKYDLYTQIKHQMLVLGWDQEKGTFYIKEKVETIKEISFLEFLKKREYWSPMY